MEMGEKGRELEGKKRGEGGREGREGSRKE